MKGLNEQIAAVKCRRRECARLHVRAADQPRPDFCPHCSGPVEDVPLIKPRRRL